MLPALYNNKSTRLQICHNKVKLVYEFRKIFAGSGFTIFFSLMRHWFSHI